MNLTEIDDHMILMETIEYDNSWVEEAFRDRSDFWFISEFRTNQERKLIGMIEFSQNGSISLTYSERKL